MKQWIAVMVLLVSGSIQWVQAENYAEREAVQKFVAEVSAKHQLDADWVMQIVSQGERKQAILDAVARPAERVLTWGEYRRIFIEPTRLEQGLVFWRENRELVERIAREYRVEPEILLAIIGVETRYGRVTGSYRVIDALMTLSFDYPPRSRFFTGQLEQFLLMVHEQDIDAALLKGSYAGAMGYGQFIAGSYRAYAVDGDGDGRIDIWNNKADALASVANYFIEHRWQWGDLVAVELSDPVADKSLISQSLQPDKTVADLRAAGVNVPQQLADDARVTLMALETEFGEEYWLGFDNFYSISRYNHSHMYSLAVYQLSQLLRAYLDMP